MEFGAEPIETAEGGIVAHSLRGPGYAIKKGARLTASDIDALRVAKVTHVTVARYGEQDMAEDNAAHAMAEAACGSNLRIDAAFTGRCNLRADASGVLRVEAQAINRANAIDEALTIATPPDFARLEEGQLAATAKVIPYAADRGSVEQVTATLRGALTLHPFQPMRGHLIVTRTEGQKDSLAEKGVDAIRKRLTALGSRTLSVDVVPHTEAAVQDALDASAQNDLTLILGGSATSDRRDVAPAAVVAAGGMPVDPGNLLALGTFRDQPLVVLPGCARSPALNGADWVLERLAARLPVTGQDIAGMGVGGLLKEVPTRPQPRER